jgi:hypothetical protein
MAYRPGSLSTCRVQVERKPDGQTKLKQPEKVRALAKERFRTQQKTQERNRGRSR